MHNISITFFFSNCFVKVSVTVLYCFATDVYTLINYFGFVSWTMSAFAVIGLLYLRWKEPDRARPYKVIEYLTRNYLVP